MGIIALALGIHDRFTRSVFFQRHLVATYQSGLASRLLRTAVFWRIPCGVCLTAAGLALFLGGSAPAVVPVLQSIALVAAVVWLVAYLRPIRPLKPTWFLREEAAGFPILRTPDVPARRPIFVWIMSVVIIVPLGMVLLAAPNKLLLLIRNVVPSRAQRYQAPRT
jgi:hypothetical protein